MGKPSADDIRGRWYVAQCTPHEHGTEPMQCPFCALRRALDLLAEAERLAAYYKAGREDAGREFDECADKLAAAQRDTERLDWLDAHNEHTLDCYSDIWCCYPAETEAPDNYQGITVREAIDSARDAERGK